MSQSKTFNETNIRKELSKLSKLQLIKKCKQNKVSVSNSKKAMIDTLIKKYKKKQTSNSKKKNPIIKAIRTKKRKSLKLKSNRLKLLKLFQSSNTSDTDNNFFEFVWENPDKFVVTVIDIILDKTAASQDENDLSTMLFHQFRSDSAFWLDLKPSIKNTLKRKLLNGIIELDGTDKSNILAHIIPIIASFEEWNKLIQALTDLSAGKTLKLKILGAIAAWAPERFETHSLQIANTIYAETLHMDENNIDSFESLSLFKIMSVSVAHRNIDDVTLLMKIMKATVVFMLKVYVENYDAVKLFDTSLNINTSVCDKIYLNATQSYDTADICFRLLCQLHFMHFDAIPSTLHNEIVFVLHVFLQMNADKIAAGLIQFAEERDDWDEEEWNFATISHFILSILFEIHDKKKSIVYDSIRNSNSNLIQNIICNVDYDVMHEQVYSGWPHLLQLFDVHYFWHQKRLLVPLLQQKHPSCTYEDMKELKDKLYKQEWFAVHWFIRKNYSKLYDEINVPVTEIILKYLTDYASINIVRRECDDYFAKITAKSNENVLQETVEAIIDALKNTLPVKIIKEIYCHLLYSESSMKQEIVGNYILAPILDQVVPCIVISTPKHESYSNVFNYNLASIKLKLGWFACHSDKENWPTGGKYCICVQQFDVENPMEPNNKQNEILFKSDLFTITTQDYETCELDNINLKLNNASFYLVYIMEFDPTLNDGINQCYEANKMNYSIKSTNDFYADQTSAYWKKSIGLSCTAKLSEMLMTTFVYYSISKQEYHNNQKYCALYDITFNCV